MVSISVITACYNRRSLLPGCLDSVQRQRSVDLEHLVIDGASSDGSAEFLFNQKLSRLRVYSEPDNGIYDALNKGIRLSRSDVIGFLHTDDFFASNEVLAHVAEAFLDPEIDVVYGDLDYVAERDVGRVVRRWKAGQFNGLGLKFGWMPPHPTLFVRREVYDRIGGFDPSYRISGDYHFILKIFSATNIRAAYLPFVITKMRTGGASNHSVINILRKTLEDRRALSETGIGGWGTVFFKNIRKIPQLFHYCR